MITSRRLRERESFKCTVYQRNVGKIIEIFNVRSHQTDDSKTPDETIQENNFPEISVENRWIVMTKGSLCIHVYIYLHFHK